MNYQPFYVCVAAGDSHEGWAVWAHDENDAAQRVRSLGRRPTKATIYSISTCAIPNCDREVKNGK